MKVNLAENMRRFGTKNLNENAIRNINALIYEQVPKTTEEAETQLNTTLTDLEIATALVNRAATAAKVEAASKADTEKQKNITSIQLEVDKCTKVLLNPNIDRKTKKTYGKQLQLLLDKLNGLTDVSSTKSKSDDERTADVKFKAWAANAADVIELALNVVGLFSAAEKLKQSKFPLNTDDGR